VIVIAAVNAALVIVDAEARFVITREASKTTDTDNGAWIGRLIKASVSTVKKAVGVIPE
jgi:hypothetical protein